MNGRMAWAAIVVLVAALPVRAEIKFGPGIGDRMVVQRDVPVRIWGWDRPGEEVTVSLGAARAANRANAEGRWEIELPPMKAGGPHEIVVLGSETRTLKNVLVGEVWFCSGQSNMGWALVRAKNADLEIAAADYPELRLMTVPERPKGDPRTDPEIPWAICTPKTVSYWSATAYFYGRELQKKLGVPVGLVVSSVNGTRIEPWTPASGVAAVPELAGKDKAVDGDLYRRMIEPYVKMPIRGVIWYQGEGNVGDGMLYYHRMRALVGGWRKNWGQGDFPFYYVQLTPLNWGGKPVDQHPQLWEAQLESLRIPNTGMVVTTDIGNIGDAHPRNKQDVGKRLALWALAKTYGYGDIVYSGPLYKSHRREAGAIRIDFDYANGGLASRDGKPLTWFTIAGADGKFVPARAEIDGASVRVWARDVAEPVAVRFGWHQIAEPNLMNIHGLPASPFRTDRP